jgi:hypothetical protein
MFYKFFSLARLSHFAARPSKVMVARYLPALFGS